MKIKQDLEQEKSLLLLDASASWNGYNHQGKSAIFVTLSMLKQIAPSDIANYELELEWLEDFSIKLNGEYQSIHQVKTYKDRSFSNYKEAIWLLLCKLLEIDTIEKAFLHTTVELSDLEQLKAELLKKEIKEKTQKSDDEKKGIKKKKSSKYMSPFEAQNKVLAAGEFTRLFEKFDIYKYRGNSYCELETIEHEIKKNIEERLGTQATKLRVDRTYLYLLGLIDKNIQSRHVDIQRKSVEKKVTIKFQEIVEILDTDYESMSLDYVSFKLKDEFISIIENYKVEILDYDLRTGNISKMDYEKTIELIEDVFRKVNILDNLDFINFCLKISPHSMLDKDDVSHLNRIFRECLNKSGLETCFFEILKQIKRNLENDKWIFTDKNKGGVNISYLPSTIIEDDTPSYVNRLSNNILSNPHPNLLNDVDVIITKSISPQLLVSNNTFRNVEEVDDNVDENYHDRITKAKKIMLMDISSAKGELI